VTRNHKTDGDNTRWRANAHRLLSNVLFVATAPASVGAAIMLAMGYHGLPWITFAAALAVVPLALGLRVGAILSGLYASLILVGWACQLILTQPLWFGLLERPYSLSGYAATIVLVVEAAATALILAWRWKAVWSGLRTFDATIWIGLAMLAAVSCVTFSSHIGAGDYRGLFIQWVERMSLLTLHSCALAAFAASLPKETLATMSQYLNNRLTLPGGSSTQPRSWDGLVAPIAAVLVLIVSVAYALLSFGGAPHLEDEVAYLFQARTFAEGALWTAPPPVAARKAFDFYLLNVEGNRWFSVTMPGWPIVLSLGVKIGAPWLVNPVLAGVSVLAAHALVLRLSNLGVANLTAILMATSPWLQEIGGSLMPHAVTLAALLVAGLAIANAKAARLSVALALSFAAGCLMGLTLLVRPQEGLVLGVLAGLWILWGRPVSKSLPSAGAYAVGCLLIGTLLLVWNVAMTGDPMSLVQSEYLDRAWVGGSNRFGFGPDIGPPERWGALDVFWPGHSPLEAIINAQHSLSELSFEMYGWAIGSLGLVFLALKWNGWRGLVGVMIVVIAITIAAHLLYWHTAGYYVGPRYWFMLFAPVAILSAIGAENLIRRLSGKGDGAQRFGAVVVVLILQGMVVSGWRMSEHFPDYNGFDSEYRTLAESHELENALVFVHDTSDSAYGSAAGFADPLLREGRPIFVRPADGKSNARIATVFPNRRPMHVTRNSDGRLSLNDGLPPTK